MVSWVRAKVYSIWTQVVDQVFKEVPEELQTFCEYIYMCGEKEDDLTWFLEEHNEKILHSRSVCRSHRPEAIDKIKIHFA